MNLQLEDFEAFHEAVHHQKPFSWQSRLVRELAASRRWPRTLDIPTGTGKTTCIDIALFLLAMDAQQAPAERWCPRRIAMVVDRRIVVDQAARRGRRIARALAEPGAPVLARVAEALASLTTEGAPPLGVFTLRGGVPKDDGWARTPDQPLILASTVDQIGSRMLLQGYGVSRGMRPVHAGLLANDTLLLLDEVHLSQPFQETLDRLGRLRERFERTGLPNRFQVSFLSATPGNADSQPFRLTPEELAPDSDLGLRLHAKKPSRIVRVAGRHALAEKITAEGISLLERHDTVLAVVNRVAAALSVAQALRLKVGDSADVVLLTGRMRPLDRDDVVRALRPRVATGRDREPGARKLIVVATQCIEAGADFDFDALVSESASFDALRQRFGRIDRLGRYQRAEGVIVHDRSEKDDPIYGTAIESAVAWLEEQAGEKARTIDFGSLCLPDAPDDASAPRAHAPRLLPAYLDLWSQTSPAPAAVPEPGLFLHGPKSGPEDVQVIWRADLDEQWFDVGGLGAAARNERTQRLGAIVGSVPPSSLEALSLPFMTARRWLAARPDVLGETADLEVKEAAESPPVEGSRFALRWRGDESEIIGAEELRPGDTIVVPCDRGGVDARSRCFDADSTEAVPDHAERAALVGRATPVLRMHGAVLQSFGLGDLSAEDRNALVTGLRNHASTAGGWQRVWLEHLARNPRPIPVIPPEGAGAWVTITGPRVPPRDLTEALGEDDTLEDGVELTTDDEDSPHIGVAIGLGRHSSDVEAFVRGYGLRLGLPEAIASDLALAAWLHDIGKADRRFQVMLRGGSEIAWYRDAEAMLAKSALPRGSKAEQQQARLRSGYPRGARHEVQSLALIAAAGEQVARLANDLDLVLHLVGSHHGHCRPFAPPVEDPQPAEVALPGHRSETFGSIDFAPTSSANQLHRLDSPLADRFWKLVARYGWLELCWLEAILRLADHRASEMESGDAR